MDYKEKYKEALNKAQEELKSCGTLDCDAAKQIFRIFPELQKSEDELIREELIKFLERQNFIAYKSDHDYRKWISWVEKQGEQKPVDKVETIYKIGDFVHCTTINGFEYTYIYKSNHGEVIHAFVNYSCGTHGVVSIDDMLFESSIFTKRKATTEEIVTLLQSIHKNGFIWDAEKKELKKIEQNPTYKVEPKFKIGDWVVFNNCHQSIYQVEKIEDGYYILRHTHGGTFRVCILHDENLRLWSIEDANDGDVLLTKECEEPKIVFILKASRVPKNCVCSYYCYYNIMYPDFATDEVKGCIAPKCADLIPATKEQRDILFQKIKEAGYEWDSKTKQLIKL